MEENCLDCHKAVAFLKDRGRGLHGQAGLTECARCHPEHAGAGFDLIQWKEGSAEAFDHARTGWALAGKHASLACGRCHQPAFGKSPAAGMSPRSDPSRGWIGLDDACASCHEDFHGGALGAECSTCHEPSGWKTAASFDHGKASFPLTGKHADVACAKCHLAPGLDLVRDAQGRPLPRYKPLPHQECSSCHADPHDGRLGKTCSSCHTTSGFKSVTKASFDHERTRFPLGGAHRTVACEGCHGSGAARKARPESGRCGSCHAEPHAGTATLAGKPADCSACHTVKGWKKPVFTAALHASTDFPLEGRHAQAACATCHVKETDPTLASGLGKAAVRLHPTHARCADCHAGAHGGQLASLEGGSACERCHAVDGWKKVRFTAADHRKDGFPLEGAHETTPCSTCHAASRPGLPPLNRSADLGKAEIAFALDEIACADCHRDPHAGRFAAAERGAGTGACLGCHGMDSFRPAKIDTAAHARFSFPLEGAHRAVPCLDCHKELAARAKSSSLRLAPGDHPKLDFARSRSRCEECHHGPHGDQFARNPARGCGSCHGVEAFTPASRFDHDTGAAFALKGAHARVACRRCHAATAEDGKARVVYRGVPSRCEACHVSRVPGEETPS